MRTFDGDTDDGFMTIYLNGESQEVPDGLTLAGLLEWLKLPADRVAVERNLSIVPRDRWTETLMEAGDRLEVVHFVGGGSAIG
jgi:thiamine biosynthesis protein ThiS